jgi:hypothetical protein
LEGFARVRDDLAAWQVGYAPRVELAVDRQRLELLRDLLALFPLSWRLAAAGAIAAGIALLVFAAAGTRLDLGAGEISFGLGPQSSPSVTRPESAPAAVEAAASERLTSAEVEEMIRVRVEQSREAEARSRNELRAQIASLRARLDASGRTQAELAQTVTRLRDEQRGLLARTQTTLGEWLFASNEGREAEGSNQDHEK